MNHMIYEPEYHPVDAERVFAYIQSDRKIVVRWEYHNTKWCFLDDHVCEDFHHFISVWEGRWDA